VGPLVGANGEWACEARSGPTHVVWDSVLRSVYRGDRPGPIQKGAGTGQQPWQ
jgi:hypothetical protein